MSLFHECAQAVNVLFDLSEIQNYTKFRFAQLVFRQKRKFIYDSHIGKARSNRQK